MKSKLLYLLTYVGMWLLAILPFPVLYALSDFIYFWLYHVIGNRRKVVRTNLKNSFPEKSAAELKAIERKFFHYLGTDFFDINNSTSKYKNRCAN